MEIKRTIKITYKVLIVVTIIIFIVGIYNIITFVVAISDSGISPQLVRDNSNGNWILTFNGNPRNKGFLDVGLSFEISIFDESGRVVANNSTFVVVRAGGSQTINLTMTIPSEMAPGGNLEQARGSLEMKMGVSEFGGLMALKQIMRVGSGAS